MKKYFINYANNGFLNSQQIGLKSAESFGFISKGYNNNDIDETFKIKNNKILSQSRGAGYWLWKPYLILKTLNQIENDSYLVYMDSGAKIIKNVDNILRMINHKGVLNFSMKQKTSKWTKGDCFFYLNKNNKNDFSEENQMQATYLFFRKCSYSVSFVEKWLENCLIPGLIEDTPNIRMDNFKDFIDHRHDQAILSLMVYNENIMYIPQIDQYSKEHGYSDDWILVDRHGNRN
jgi:hypothetical protein